LHKSVKKICDLYKIFISLFDPGRSKNACHIHKLLDATASSITIGSLTWPQYIPRQAVEQIFYFQYIQSILSNISKNPCHSTILSSLTVSSYFRVLRYLWPKTSQIALTNLLKYSIILFSAIHTYSST
jgi:hypothetical protein